MCQASHSTICAHTFGTRMAAAGVPLRTIQHWIGHADSKTTQVYLYQPSEHEAHTVNQALRLPTEDPDAGVPSACVVKCPG